MRTKFIYSNNDSNKSQTCYPKKKISFGAGMTAKFKQEIMNADVLEISNRLSKKGISTDFKDNKVIAWCSEKTVDIFQQFNERFGTQLALPKGIFVENFEDLNTDNQGMYGFCNFFRANLKKNSDEITSGKTLFFNNNLNWLDNTPIESRSNTWMYIDEIADARFKEKESSSAHFLYTIFHEFFHAVHEDNLLNEIGSKELVKKVKSANEEKQIEAFQKKYGLKLSVICDNATNNGFEAVACDMPRVIINSLDITTLTPTKNPFINTPYEYISYRQRINLPEPTNEEERLKEILRNFWNGKFD